MTYPPKTGIGQLNGRKLESGCIYPAEFGSSSGNLELEKGPFWQEIWKPSKLNRLNDGLIKQSIGDLSHFLFSFCLLPDDVQWWTSQFN